MRHRKFQHFIILIQATLILMFVSFNNVYALPNTQDPESCADKLSKDNIQSYYEDQVLIQSKIDALRAHAAQNKFVSPFKNAFDQRSLNIAQEFAGNAFPLFNLLLKRKNALIKSNHKWDLNQYFEIKRDLLSKLPLNLSSLDATKTFAIIESLRALQTIHALTPIPETEIKKMEEEKAKDRENKKKQKAQNDIQQDQLEKDPTKPYQVANEDVTNSEYSSKPFYQFGTSILPNVLGQKIPHLRYRAFDTWDHSGILRTSLATRGTSDLTVTNKHTEGWMFIKNPSGLSEFAIPVGYGSEPIIGIHQDIIVKRVGTDIFTVQSKNGGPLPAQVNVPLNRAKTSLSIDSEALSVLTRKSGIAQNSWPKDILDKIAEISSTTRDSLAIAESLSNYIAQSPEYQYCSSEGGIDKSKFETKFSEIETAIASGTPKSVAYANGKLFKCDGAALLGATLLRDFFELPTRVAHVLNIAGSMDVEGVEYFVVNSNAPAHAVVEVLHQGTWHVYDFTPKHNTPKNDDNALNNIKPFYTDQNETHASTKDNDSDSQKNESESDSDSNKQSESKDGKDKDSDKKKSDKKSNNEKKEQNSSSLVADVENADKILPNSPVNVNTDPNNTPEQIANSVYTWVLNEFWHRTPPSSWADVMSKIDPGLSSKIKHHLAEKLTPLSLFMGRNDKFKNQTIINWIEIAKQNITSNPNTSHNLLLSIHEYIELIRAARKLNTDEERLRIDITNLLNNFRKYASKDAEIHLKVNEILDALPESKSNGPISSSRHYLTDYFNRMFNGDVRAQGSQAQLKFYDQFRRGKLWRLIEAALTYRDFELSYQAEFTSSWVKTPLRSPMRKPRSRDLVSAGFSDLSRIGSWILNPTPSRDPMQSLLQPLSEGRQLMVGNRHMVLRHDPEKYIEKKMSIIFIDTSGSMSGNRIRALASALVAFLHQALSEGIDTDGSLMHEVWIYPFDAILHPAIKIKSSDDADKLLASIINKSPEAPGNATNIQMCFDSFFDAAEHRYKEYKQLGGEKPLPLDIVNLVLFSDGESTDELDMEKNKARINGLIEQVDLKFKFFAIGHENTELKSLAGDFNESTNELSGKSASGSYRVISDHEIANIISKAAKAITTKGSDIYFKQGEHLEHEDIQKVRKLIPPKTPELVTKSQITNLHQMILSAPLASSIPASKTHALTNISRAFGDKTESDLNSINLPKLPKELAYLVTYHVVRSFLDSRISITHGERIILDGVLKQL